MFTDFPDVLSVADMQKALSVGRSTAYRLINDGDIKHLRIGKIIKIPKRFLIDYILSECYTGEVATSKSPVQI
jgi:excisionase family DNA binding protein